VQEGGEALHSTTTTLRTRCYATARAHPAAACARAWSLHARTARQGDAAPARSLRCRHLHTRENMVGTPVVAIPALMATHLGCGAMATPAWHARPRGRGEACCGCVVLVLLLSLLLPTRPSVSAAPRCTLTEASHVCLCINQPLCKSAATHTLLCCVRTCHSAATQAVLCWARKRVSALTVVLGACACVLRAACCVLRAACCVLRL
jgi:hypothetical protein